MKKFFLAALSLLLCVSVFTGCTSRLNMGGYDRRLVAYSDMEYERPDVEAMKESLGEDIEKMRKAPNFDELMRWYSNANELWEQFYTMYTLAMLKTYEDIYDEYFEEEYRFMEESYVELQLYSSEMTEIVLESEYAGQFREQVGDYMYQSYENSVLLNSEEVEEYKKERTTLERDYNNLLVDLTVQHEGTTYTMDELLSVGSYDLLYTLYTEYYRQNAGAFAKIYARLIELDNLTAETLGFASAADMYYTSYSRDYTPAQALEMAATIRDMFGELVPFVMLESSYSVEANYATTMDSIPKILRRIDPDMEATWNAMLEYGLYDFEASPQKHNGIAFTTYLYGYDAPYIYAYWEGTTSSASTLIHEFGHFYDNWLRYDTSVVSNIDIAECYSQGLEVLSMRYYSDLSSYPEETRRLTLSDLLQAVTYQMMLEEFQLRAYELETVDVDTLTALYSELLRDYGYGEYTNAAEDGLDYSWFRITHMFEAPFYTVGYVTSAAVALQIWEISQDDWDEAAEVYLAMLRADQNQPFVQLVESVGMDDPTARETFARIAWAFQQVFGVSSLSNAA